MAVELFAKKIGKVRKRLKFKILLSRWLFLLTGFIALILIGLSFYGFLLDKKIDSKNSMLKILEDKIESLRNIESKQIYLIDKLGSFENLLKMQKENQIVAETVLGILPIGTNLEGFKVESENMISLSGSVPNFLVLKELFDNVQAVNAYRLPIKGVEINSINFSNVGDINFSLNLFVGSGV